MERSWSIPKTSPECLSIASVIFSEFFLRMCIGAYEIFYYISHIIFKKNIYKFLKRFVRTIDIFKKPSTHFQEISSWNPILIHPVVTSRNIFEALYCLRIPHKILHFPWNIFSSSLTLSFPWELQSFIDFQRTGNKTNRNRNQIEKLNWFRKLQFICNIIVQALKKMFFW